MKSSPSPHPIQARDLASLIKESGYMTIHQGLAIDFKLRHLRLYQESTELQILHSQAVLERMRHTPDASALHDLSKIQASVPHFSRSGMLQELYAKGLLIRVQKDSATVIHESFLNKLLALPYFKKSANIQRATAALLLESIANCKTAREARGLAKCFDRIPSADNDPEIMRMVALSRELVDKTGRQPVVKVDLSRKIPLMVRALIKYVGLEDYRMRVWLGGSSRFKHVVVKVAARSEQEARQAVQKFMDEFLADDKVASREILDIFPPGSAWESGPFPVLKV